MSIHTPAPLSVLIVDDDDLVADYIDLHLSVLGCATEVVNSAAIALERLADADFDLLVTDWQMPLMDGMELVREARARRSPDSHLHIAMITSREDAGLIRQALNAGVDDFLLKPLDPVQLELAVATARRNRLLHRRLKRRASLLTTAHRRTREALERVRADIDAAAALHARLLPEPGPRPGCKLALLYRPALTLGGDTIGATELPDGGLLFFVIDVRGHGVPAALDSFHLHHRLKDLAPGTPEQLAEAAALLNREIALREDDSYATLLAGIIPADGSNAWLLRAGHPPPLLQRQNSHCLVEDDGNLPLGWFADSAFKVAEVHLSPGDRLFVYSDGITECDDAHGEPFGTERLGAVLDAARGSSLALSVEAIDMALTNRIASRALEDDVSLLAIERTYRLTDE